MSRLYHRYFDVYRQLLKISSGNPILPANTFYIAGYFMKYTIQYLSILIVWSLVIPEITTAQTQYQYVDIYNLNRKPIIQATLNGKKAYFLLDTGSNITILNLPDRSKFGFLLKRTNMEAIGLGGRAGKLYRAINVELVLGSTKIKARYLAYDMSAIVKNIHKSTRINISGIIGSEVMKQYGVVIDYKKRQVGIQRQGL